MHNIYHDIVGNIVNQRFRHFLNWPNSTGKSMVSHTVGLGLTFHGSQEVYTAESDEDRQPLRRFGKPWGGSDEQCSKTRLVDYFGDHTHQISPIYGIHGESCSEPASSDTWFLNTAQIESRTVVPWGRQMDGLFHENDINLFVWGIHCN